MHFKPLFDGCRKVKWHIIPNNDICHCLTKFYLPCPSSSTGTSRSQRAYYRGHPRRLYSVLYGSMSGLCNNSPSSEMAAHIVMFSSLWPGTSAFGLLPIIFWPLQCLFDQVKNWLYCQIWIYGLFQWLWTPWLSKILKSHDTKQQWPYSSLEAHTMIIVL